MLPSAQGCGAYLVTKTTLRRRAAIARECHNNLPFIRVGSAIDVPQHEAAESGMFSRKGSKLR
jgi:hypothetical protein